MKCAYLLAVACLCLHHNSVSSHIVTSSQKDYPLYLCMKKVNNLFNAVCGVADDDHYYEGQVLLPNQPRDALLDVMKKNRDVKLQRFLQNCCIRSCSYSELLRMC